VQKQIADYAASDATILITGATGTGKELAAQALHASSNRRSAPFVAVNCGAIAESLLESELFGYEEGAFTGSRRGGRVGLIEAAHNGTLFLDEIGEMPLPLQTRLLRVLEEREVVRVGSSKPIPVDLRIIAATHCDLTAMVADGRFRADLYYRLNVLRIDLPALSERGGDIELLATAFLKATLGTGTASWRKDAIALLNRYDWPGNVRELRNVVDRIAVSCPPGRKSIDADLVAQCAPELVARTPLQSRMPPSPSRPTMSTDADELLVAMSRRPSPQTLAQALARVGGNRKQAAELLGVSRATLWRWLSENQSMRK
jgi:propionate catabolism operon transcriptional regulator